MMGMTCGTVGLGWMVKLPGIHLGTAFLKCSAEDLNDNCEKEVDNIQGLVDDIVKEEGVYRSKT